ncbi:tRNA preQ1(34) S-adenosylmethionine ribosyltransferase-isomerase QueA [Pelagicoccus sp. NFK12]|uniref:S-adenosylmethionine:tRNA ribosyltransferase-isomerase n=1 Tax=Pelagicoccus enzymogenes TaxID=2773457 RepID=A0A927IHZ9_9BACT|nr:tRNA preQ1(34) S-adenosylmethionine ribosyltransferase-isomerase QueA [Pelagicoccus enzymogenes]MBD5780329.1 tRNA preQ1(34) S-adenosylmethionine ribosyltransferase-isomerase QueA [Pelagicoccus enzymogenes]MDQ8197768.1 tRNA preQ1(34) S-adenosylmethionine ribosyltransferase-isomerase QueA [Pelagicoccus enzymogenes]
MDSSLFDYHLPEDRIAQEPAAQRDASRLLVVHREERRIEHRHFSDLPDYLGDGDSLFRNNARVLPARLFAQRPTGGAAECLLLRPASNDGLEWWTLLRPGKKLPVGSSFARDGYFQAFVEEKNDNAEYRVRFELANHSSVAALADELGKMPLPPYIARERSDQRDEADKERYQTIYASAEKSVAAAAPTAGLHFTPKIVAQLEAQGATFHDLALHVGMGTFKPLQTERIEDHQIHREIYEISESTQSALRDDSGRRKVCIGTTSVRSVEDYLAKSDRIVPGNFVSEAAIFIYPPRQFLGVDALITNFHQPNSTLLCLVSAFLDPHGTSGIDWLKAIYAEAIERKYRFLSYGDAMLIL